MNPKLAQKLVLIWVMGIAIAVVKLFEQAFTAEIAELEESLRLSKEEFSSIKQFFAKIVNIGFCAVKKIFPTLVKLMLNI